jgi:hypothetical protein
MFFPKKDLNFLLFLVCAALFSKNIRQRRDELDVYYNLKSSAAHTAYLWVNGSVSRDEYFFEGPKNLKTVLFECRKKIFL